MRDDKIQALTFFLRNRANVVGHSLQGVDERIQVWAVDFTLHEELQICRRTVLRLPAHSTLDVEKFRLKSLWRK